MKSKMQFANYVAVAAILYTTLTVNISSYIENLRLCSSDEAGDCS